MISVEEFPDAHYIVSCYFHQRVLVIHGNYAAAVTAFLQGEKPETIAAVKADLDRLLALPTADAEALADWLPRAQCDGFEPSSRLDAREFLTGIRNLIAWSVS